MIKIQAQSTIPTDFGFFNLIALSEKENDWMPHFALIANATNLDEVVNVRFHSECVTGELFHSQKCECGPQLDAALQYMQQNGGVVVYLRQEGRNIGIINKLKAYQLQEKGMNTVEANLALNLPADGRDFQVGIDILKLIGVKKVNLLTNNPEKLKAFENNEIMLVARIPLQMKSNDNSKDYLKVKKDYFGHLLEEEK